MSVKDILLHFSPLFGILPHVSSSQFRRFTCLFVDVHTGRHLEILQRRKEAKNRTLQARRDYNRAVRKQDSSH